MLAAGAATAVAAATTAPAFADHSVAEIEARYDRRIGLYARNLQTGRTLTHRADERFGMCSTFKTFEVAALLDGRLITPDRHALDRRVHYPPSLVAGDVWAPLTREWFAQDYVPTLREVAEAAIRDSDNGAANLVLQYIGGPAAVTDFVRGIGDRVTRLDRWEPDMSEYEPGQVLDTSTPRSIGHSYQELLLGRTLGRTDRAVLTDWMLGNRTDPPFGKALPAGWRLADKTGSGGYATRNDVGIAWTDQDVPILISCMTRADSDDVERLDEPLIDTFALCVDRLA